jgi:hypothetical protein
MFGSESILFSESKIAELESVQGQVAKRILGVPRNTSNVGAESELGFKPLRLVLFLHQLKFYFRVLGLPRTRWVRYALLDHLSGGWPSPYLSYICRLRTEVSLFFEPPTLLYLQQHLFHWALRKMNCVLSSTSLPCLVPLTTFKKQPYVCASVGLDTIASFRLSNTGLGNKCPLLGEERCLTCPSCPVLCQNNEEHLFVCPSVQRIRVDTGIASFMTMCSLRGLSTHSGMVLFVSGLDLYGDPIPLPDYFERGVALAAVRDAWIRMTVGILLARQ